MRELLKLGLEEVQKGLSNKDFSASELVSAYISRAKETAHLNAYITLSEESAMDAARESDRRIAKGEARSMEGVPIGIKDLFCTKGERTTAASRMLYNFVPQYESHVTELAKSAGCVSVGKQNMDEFAMGSASNTGVFGEVRNPWDTECLAGGSSGGGAASVAAMSALVALGTDTGGSVRQPSSFCGVVGVRPTYGRCSRFGIIAYASSFDQAGVFARSTEDCAKMLQVISGHDPRDATSSKEKVPLFSEKIGKSIKGMRVGIPKEWETDGLEPCVASAWENWKRWLREAGCEIVSVSIPSLKYAMACYYVLVPAEASSNLARYDGIRYGHRTDSFIDVQGLYKKSRAEGFGWEVKRRIIIGTYVLSHGYYDAYYKKAQKVRAMIAKEFMDTFSGGIDVLLSPTSPTTAFRSDDAPTDPVTLYLNDMLTLPINVAGVCAISVPGGVSEHMRPIGLQLIAAPFQEGKLFQFASVIEKNAAMPRCPLA
ncbi:Asp-tRNA(Asn)/Glu-tRNA(Gln) amidotransferase subunit GatA [Candidatus Hydrogenosomobacter endosymbioticus]|nr:Asp-tRNA(Asn)/Glu-tRNA(Gln) amidotransferase subunit GatA [Candidatus Hydrogenosomobacter endosymbioticus]